MLKRHLSFAILALVVLVASILACSPPTPTTTAVPQAPPPTVTPYVPATLPPEPPPEDTAPPPTEAPTETLEPPTEEATLGPTPDPQPEATVTPEPTDAPTPTPTTKPVPQPTAKPTSTPTPTQGVSEGPLDFEPPRWVYSWEKQEDGVRVVLEVIIIGGAPPFTVSHGPNVHGTTTGRTYYLDFDWGCGNMAQSITVESSDGQKVKKDYWIGTDQQPWCGG